MVIKYVKNITTALDVCPGKAMRERENEFIRGPGDK